ncbi:heterokaryon incompatibility protein-domain-containing protein [Pestalotiopsis sp. NC0098]|nr:heterokaryon incompatibility protein-domain-containing protein [Pestalotiopsis sp. NC0098]
MPQDVASLDGLGDDTERPTRGRSPALDHGATPLYSRPLAAHKHEIRLLRLCEMEEERFKCRLEMCELWQDAHYSAGISRFAALSWCWGENPTDVDLIVDGQTVRISNNLNTALLQLWNMDEKTVWCDFICINQKDEVERGSQVAMMDRVFTRANIVYAWLGSQEGNSDLAMAMLGSQHAMDYPEDLEVATDAVVQLLSRPYFTRMWIIQEICLPENVYFLCGQMKIDYDTWVARLYSGGDSVPARYAQHLFKPIKGFRELLQQHDLGLASANFVTWLLRTRRSKASDPRDKLYALVNLASDGRRIIVAPNYTQDLLQVCRDATAQMVGVLNHTAVVLLAHRTDERTNWPSWLPNWSNIRSEPPWIRGCLNQPRKPLFIRNEVENHALKVNGTKVDDLVAIFKAVEQNHDLASQSLHGFDVVRGLRDCLAPHRGITRLDFARAILMTLEQMENRSDNGGTNFYLQNWLTNYVDFRIGPYSIREHFERWRGDSIGPIETTDALRSLAVAVNQGIANLNHWRMVVAVFQANGLQIVYRDARVGDEIFVFSNSPLNVVMRPLSDSDYSFVGEVYPLRGRLDIPTLLRGRVVIR